MAYFTHFIFSPGGDPSSSGTPAKTAEELKKEADEKLEETEKAEDDKTLGEKIQDELQAWSNKDQADQNFDDTRV